MNFIPFIAIPIAILLIIFVAYSGFTTGKKCENDIYETMKKNNNKVTNVKEIPMFSSEEIPFSRMNSSGFKRGHNIYRVDYVNKNGENKTSYVKYEGFSTKGTWKEV